MLSFLLYIFGIAWSSEILLILIYKINLLHGVTLKSFCRDIFYRSIT